MVTHRAATAAHNRSSLHSTSPLCSWKMLLKRQNGDSTTVDGVTKPVGQGDDLEKTSSRTEFSMLNKNKSQRFVSYSIKTL
jgi:hypothetical protein